MDKSRYNKIVESLQPAVPQTVRLNEQQVRNNASGYGYTTNDREQLDRFLLIGTFGGTFYVSEKKLTDDNVASVKRLIQSDGPYLVRRLVELDTRGRCQKKSAVLYTLALAIKYGNTETRTEAYNAILRVCRTGSHLFELIDNLKAVKKGWGRGLKRAVANWYTSRSDNDLAYQVIKYRTRNGFSHKDVLKLAHPRSDSDILKYVVKGDLPSNPQIRAYEAIKNSEGTTVKEAKAVIIDNRLPREALPTTWLNDVNVWKAMLDAQMPTTALLRNLAKMTAIGLFDDKTYTSTVYSQLTDTQILRKARIHPINVLFAEQTYSQGKGTLGNLVWNPNSRIKAALNEALIDSFGILPKSDIETLIAIDVSGSMNTFNISGIPLHKISSLMAVANSKTNPNNDTVLFDWGATVNPIEVQGRRFDDVFAEISRMGGGGTDVTLPIKHAIASGGKYKLIVIYTDMETWAGRAHAEQLWDEYKRMVPDAKLVFVAMTANRINAMPKSNDVLQICGFDPNVPNIINAFAGLSSDSSEEDFD